MASMKGSEFSRSMGDEPGTVGSVGSSANMKETIWITFSFDVKLEGKNASGMLKLSDALEDHDDVQNVYSNFDIEEKEQESLTQ